MTEQLILAAKEIDTIRAMLSFWKDSARPFKCLNDCYGTFTEVDMENLNTKLVHAAAQSYQKHKPKERRP
jgi:hypothetical protein